MLCTSIESFGMSILRRCIETTLTRDNWYVFRSYQSRKEFIDFQVLFKYDTIDFLYWGFLYFRNINVVAISHIMQTFAYDTTSSSSSSVSFSFHMPYSLIRSTSSSTAASSTTFFRTTSFP